MTIGPWVVVSTATFADVSAAGRVAALLSAGHAMPAAGARQRASASALSMRGPPANPFPLPGGKVRTLVYCSAVRERSTFADRPQPAPGSAIGQQRGHAPVPPGPAVIAAVGVV